MATEHGFSVVLPSNSCPQLFPGNTLASYKVKLAKRLDLQPGMWMVGLREIAFPRNWKNLQDGWIQIHFNELDRTTKFLLKSGYYDSVSDLLEQVHQLLINAHIEKQVVLYYDDITARVILQNKSDHLLISFSSQIKGILGFVSRREFYFDKGVHTGDRAVDMTEGFSSLYVYTNIVENRLVGDSLVPLLRTVPFDTGKRRSIHQWIQFQHVEYLPVINSNSDVIEINIRRDDGTLVAFEGGKVVITLHFIRIPQ